MNSNKKNLICDHLNNRLLEQVPHELAHRLLTVVVVVPEDEDARNAVMRKVAINSELDIGTVVETQHGHAICYAEELLKMVARDDQDLQVGFQASESAKRAAFVPPQELCTPGPGAATITNYPTGKHSMFSGFKSLWPVALALLALFIWASLLGS